MVTPVKTDLPSGIVGELVSWSQDHIDDHLLQIYRFIIIIIIILDMIHMILYDFFMLTFVLFF